MKSWALDILAYILASLILVAAAAEGAEHPAVVRVMARRCVNGSCSTTAYGTGTVVDVDGTEAVVLTCAHLFRGQSSSVTVKFPDGVTLAAEVKAIDHAWDLAALTVSADRQFAVPPATVAADHPKPGDQLQSCGYGRDGRYWCNQGTALGYARTATTMTHETLELSGRARDGDSGGPVFNQRGELAGVLWGTDGRIVGATYCIRVRKFLGRLFPRLANRFGQRPMQPLGPGPLVPVQPTQPGGGFVTEGSPSTVKPPVTSPNVPAEPEPSPPPTNAVIGELRGKIDVAVGLIASLRERIDAAQTLGADDVRSIAKEVALGAARDRAPGFANAILPGLLAALGWTGPPAIAAIVGLGLLRFLLRRRRSRDPLAQPSSPAAAGVDPRAAKRIEELTAQLTACRRRSTELEDRLAGTAVDRGETVRLESQLTECRGRREELAAQVAELEGRIDREYVVGEMDLHRRAYNQATKALHTKDPERWKAFIPSMTAMVEQFYTALRREHCNARTECVS